MLGGLNYETNKEVGQLKIKGLETDEIEYCEPSWRNIDYQTGDSILGRCRHTSCVYEDKIYSFGGCFMFNRKRQIRECTNQVTVYDSVH